MKREEAIISMRGALDWLQSQGEVKVLKEPVDPILEMGAIMKALDEGPALLADNVKGYSHARLVGNLFARKDRVAKLLGAADYSQCKRKIMHALKNPTPARIVEKGPCQEVYIPREEVDPFALFPMIKHTEQDGGRFFGSGVHFIGGKYFRGGTQLALYRMSFRGKDYASINMVPGGHGDLVCENFPNEKIPCTVNISPSPMVEFVARSNLMPIVFPPGLDELGVAGTLQGSPVNIVKARTVDAYAIADAEWVIEGYIVPYERVWETEEAEKAGKQGEFFFHPEWARYLGRAYRNRKFEVTAVTRRKDKPLCYAPFFGSSAGDSPFIEANWMEMADRLFPGFVVDVSHFLGLTAWSGIVFQVKKRRRSDEGLQRNLLAAALGVVRGLRLAIVVDDDINIHSPEDLFFALVTRVSPETDIIRGTGGRGQSYQPMERVAAGADAGKSRPVSMFEGGIGIDATVPLMARDHFQRPRYAVDKVDMHKWFTEEELQKIRQNQSEYIRFLAETGYP